jgi:cytochrome o ubiquinol oxidase operon protein cyoD
MKHELIESQPKHGTIASYVVGFGLSLVFTFIPYYLVTQKAFPGWLLVIIIGFGILQMLIQVLFFLHLGRKPYQPWQTGFLVATIGEIIVVVGASIWIMQHLHYNMTPADMKDKLVGGEAIYQVGGQKTGACEQIGANHKVTIKYHQVSPEHTQARLCDTITFINEDGEVKDIAFGNHPDHGTYAGEMDLITRQGHPKSLTLSQLGTYRFHDHLNETTTGSFTVEP